MYPAQLHDLFKRRFHGSVNIKGIDFQILYALYTSLELLNSENGLEQLTLEGIEDVDLKPFQKDNVFIQVKTSVNNWHISNLASPLLNFSDLNKTHGLPQKFQLVLDFQPRQSILNLFTNHLSVQEKDNLINDVLKLKEIKAAKINREEIFDIISNCEIKFFDKIELVKKTKIKICELFNMHPDESEFFLLSILYKFVEWSIERKTITKTEILDFKIKYSENKERSKEFEAIGKGLIERISWNEVNESSDYYEGKRTSSSHIAGGLDIRRPKWLEKINEVYKTTKVCIIREASGQGKSTLAFRYAYDYWKTNYTFLIKVIESAEDAEKISNYLKSLCELGFVINVLIDDINKERKYFSNVLKNCADYEVYFLLTIRNDDYQSFASIGKVQFEFIYPQFDRIEAKLIFQNLKKENRIHSKTISPDWAYERISSPKCLIEFIFLVTQGEMLYERLSEQIKRMRENRQDAKIDLLRKAIVADVCKTPLSINRIIANDISGADYQGMISELKDEFVAVENDYISGYHWIRSIHILRILHENYANPAITALKVIPLINDNKLSEFIGNLIEISDFNPSIFINNFKSSINNPTSSLYLDIISGLFKIGENEFFLANKDIYEEGYEKFNDGVLFLFTSNFNATKPVSLFDIFGENAGFKEAKDLSEKFRIVPRGFDLVKSFVETNKPDFVIYSQSSYELGKILDWSYWINFNLIVPSHFKQLIDSKEILNLEIGSFSLLSQSLFRVYPEIYEEWFNNNKCDIIKKLESELEAKISIQEQTISFTPLFMDDINEFEEILPKKLDKLYSTIPFGDNYRVYLPSSSPSEKYLKIWLIRNKDKLYKEIDSKTFIFESDSQKNRILHDIVDSYFRVKTWYEFTECYYNLRLKVMEYSNNLALHIKGISVNFKEKNPKYISNIILHSHKQLPIQIESLRKPFSDCREAFNSFNNFLIMKSSFVDNESDEDAKRLMFINYNNFLIKLLKMQEFFAKLKLISPNYFAFEELDPREINVYFSLKESLKHYVPSSNKYWDLNTIVK